VLLLLLLLLPLLRLLLLLLTRSRGFLYASSLRTFQVRLLQQLRQFRPRSNRGTWKHLLPVWSCSSPQRGGPAAVLLSDEDGQSFGLPLTVIVVAYDPSSWEDMLALLASIGITHGGARDAPRASPTPLPVPDRIVHGHGLSWIRIIVARTRRRRRRRRRRGTRWRSLPPPGP
jgi:hypothetical protein